MPRTARASAGGIAYHAINRGNAQTTVFHDADDYAAFEQLLADTHARVPMRLLAYCLMPNHFYLALRAHGDGDLSQWMQWLLGARVRRYHRFRGISGHVWQGRFKAPLIQQDHHLLTALRCVKRNLPRTGLARRAERWRWSSLATRADRRVESAACPVDCPRDWVARVNQPETEAELVRLQQSVHRGTPLGSAVWVRRIAARLGLESTLRPRGRPRKGREKQNVPVSLFLFAGPARGAILAEVRDTLLTHENKLLREEATCRTGVSRSLLLWSSWRWRRQPRVL